VSEKGKCGLSVYGSLVPARVKVSCWCPACKAKHIEAEGMPGPVEGYACTGHDADDYCYCPGEYFHVAIACPECGAALDVRIDR
jgi:hypothetical protein